MTIFFVLIQRDSRWQYDMNNTPSIPERNMIFISFFVFIQLVGCNMAHNDQAIRGGCVVRCQHLIKSVMGAGAEAKTGKNLLNMLSVPGIRSYAGYMKK
jgi:hypothetical protein